MAKVSKGKEKVKKQGSGRWFIKWVLNDESRSSERYPKQGHITVALASQVQTQLYRH
jgi:hypothetical protein